LAPVSGEPTGNTGPSRRRALFTLGAVPAIAAITGSTAASAAPLPRVSAARRIMNIVAHEDDDLLFLSPDLLHDIQAGKTLRTIFLTAGDAADQVAGGTDQQTKYWKARETGNRAAYAQMAGVANSWTESQITVNGHRLAMFTLDGRPNISEIFLRLPDGNPDGSGSVAHHHQSLLKLRAAQIPAIDAIDGSASYSKADLLATVTAVTEQFGPEVIRAQDYGAWDWQPVLDHADHTATAYLAHSVSNAYSSPHEFIGYLDYIIETLPSNVSGSDLAAKQAAFYLYDQYDSLLQCYTPALRKKHGNCAAYEAWLSRQYRVQGGPGWDEPCLVPDITDYPTEFGSEPVPKESAESRIRAQGGWVGTVTYAYDDSIPQGFVIHQAPEPDTKFLPQGTKVDILVSKGPKPEPKPKPKTHGAGKVAVWVPVTG
jgi:LmbE family N-acetylglucosaminyl deacetylase